MNQQEARLIMAIARKEWSCGVFRSGTHNGATCSPAEPHGGWWGCGYRYIFSAEAEAVERVAAPAS